MFVISLKQRKKWMEKNARNNSPFLQEKVEGKEIKARRRVAENRWKIWVFAFARILRRKGHSGKCKGKRKKTALF
jgi:hypothetical protein